MKVICDRGALVESLNLVGGVIVSRTPKPVLSCIKVTANDGALTLSGTDMEVAVKLTTPRVEVAESGDMLVPSDKLLAIVRESIDATLTIEANDEAAKITGQDSKFTIYGHNIEDYPPIPEYDGDPDFEVSAEELHRLIAMTIFATARENSRYAINGVLVEREKNKLTVVATDGHRLALAKGMCTSHNDTPQSAIVPTKALNLLLRLFDDAEQTVSVKMKDGQIMFATEEATLSTNLVEGNFPPYADVIPKDGDKKVTIATDVLVSAVRRAALLTNEESKGVRMAFDQAGLTLSSRAPEMGEAEIKVEIDEYVGDEVEIGFNPQYLLDALKVADESQVHIDMKAPNKPGVLRTGPQFLYVIMPVNLQ
ncbi:DNA polymerase III subunit beta [Poriferisphaera corsica]|uniref:Beta sliding clamp n=1 Tax=Poriferisphaera corsica TaxID=2528020 RepID=A0A517YQS1_9BACT|nr:DNA polymerase III subunit beta [Poriferisphaera corsica]QDU32555.1 DNA polymerase III subunit beta [Poriferisphaera corsica]